MNVLLDSLTGLAPWALYGVLAGGAAVENVLPPVPADTFVLLGGFLAGRGLVDLWTVFWVVWAGNVAGALLIWWAGGRYGRPFFATGLGRRLVDAEHLGQLARSHARWGMPAIFVSRFLPGFRALVPVFAGVTHMSFWRIAPPTAVASALWYGALVWLGSQAGANLEEILGWLSRINRGLLAVSLVVLGGVGIYWYRRRRSA